MAVLAELVEVCGAAHVRPADLNDLPGDLASAWVVAPGDVAQLAAVVRLAAERDLAVVARGGRTKLDWGASLSTVDIVIDVARLAGRHRHAPGELTATFGAGTPLLAIDPELEPTGQRLALDPPSRAAGATVGGVLATAESGPLRQLTGPVADLVREIEYVGGDGEVHGVAGAEAAALCGSLGALGVITAATLRLHPRPPASAWIHRSVHTPVELLDLVMLLDTTPLSVAAIEADWPALDPVLARVPRPRTAPDAGARPEPQAQPVTGPGPVKAGPVGPGEGPGALAVLIEGTSAGVADRVRTAVNLLGGDAVAVTHPPSWWGRDPAGPGDVVLRLTAPPEALHAVGYTLRDATVGAVWLRGAMGAGTILAGLPAHLPAERVVGAVETVRQTLATRSGSCTVLRARAEVYEALLKSDPGLPEARHRKERFDPAGRFSPGRLPLRP